MSKKEEVTEDQKEHEKSIGKKKPTCGIIMPISANDECSADHWSEVLEVLKEVGELAGFETNLVSTADHASVIQRTIVQNVFSSDVVICDVSCKNPNVMFELGMRLAFDKATVIIKDEITGYSFDTGIIEHLEYPRGLRLGKMNKFKDDLAAKLKSTHTKSIESDYSMFLHNFGTFKVAKLEETEVAANEFVLESLQVLQKTVDDLSRKISVPSALPKSNFKTHYGGSNVKYVNADEALEFYVLSKIKNILSTNPSLLNTLEKREKFIKALIQADESEMYLQSRLLPDDDIRHIVNKYFQV